MNKNIIAQHSTLVEKNLGISIARVVGMFSIILCHLFNESLRFSFLGQLFNVGVFVFLFISALLYGKKIIGNTKEWLLKRGKKILIPFYIFMIFLFVVRFILYGTLEWKSYAIYAFNIQGFVAGVTGAGHLWFLTLIMLCYLVTPILDKMKPRVQMMPNIQRSVMILLAMGIHLIIVYYISGVVGLYYFYLLAYAVVYYYGYFRNLEFSKKQIVALTLFMCIAVATRVISKSMIDESILYDNVLVGYTQAVLGAWILVMCLNMKGLIRKIHGEKIIIYLDGISFEIYIVHYMFCVGPFRVMSITESFVVNSIIVMMLSYICALVLRKICGVITR